MLPSFLKLLSEGFDQQRMIVPRFNELRRKRNTIFSTQRRPIKSHAGPGILWGKADHDRPFDSIGFHDADCVSDKRLPIAHSDVNPQFQFLRQEVSLLLSQFSQRRWANDLVAVLNLIDHLVWQRAPAGDPT